MNCREYTLPRDDGSSQPRGWIQGNTKIGPVLEVTTSCLHGKYGVEIRIWSQSEDNTHSWVRISHGSNKFVMDSNNNDTEVPEDQLEEHALQLDAKEEEMGSVGELFTVCAHIVLKCLYLVRIVRLENFWSANKLVRAITKGTKACDTKRSARWISYIHHTCDYKPHCHVEKYSTTMQIRIVSGF